VVVPGYAHFSGTARAIFEKNAENKYGTVKLFLCEKTMQG